MGILFLTVLYALLLGLLAAREKDKKEGCGRIQAAGVGELEKQRGKKRSG